MLNLVHWSIASVLGLTICIIVIIGGVLLFRLFLNKEMTRFVKSHELSLRERYQLGRKKYFNFDKFNNAISLEVYHLHEPSFQIIIEDKKRVDFAKQFIQQNSSGWVKIISADGKMPFTTCSIELKFYEKTSCLIGTYNIAGNQALVYGHLSHGYWKLVNSVDLEVLAQTLGVPENLLQRFREEECFPIINYF